jgi:SAM-dependent methyltransferase
MYMPDNPSDFYTGLVAQLYEPLAGSPADLEPILRFVKKSGSPTLELACGTGHPMLDLIERGHDVWGIDSSKEMLDLCREKAKNRGLHVQVERQLMQELNLEQHFQSCFIAGASFCLIDKLEDAQETLRRVYQHLVPGGTFLLSVFRPTMASQPSAERSKTREDGSTISVQSVAQEDLTEEQIIVTRLCYRVRQAAHVVQRVERDWRIRWYDQNQLSLMLEQVGFVIGSRYDFDGKISGPQNCNFSVVARKPISSQ